MFLSSKSHNISFCVFSKVCFFSRTHLLKPSSTEIHIFCSIEINYKSIGQKMSRCQENVLIKNRLYTLRIYLYFFPLLHISLDTMFVRLIAELTELATTKKQIVSMRWCLFSHVSCFVEYWELVSSNS